MKLSKEASINFAKSALDDYTQLLSDKQFEPYKKYYQALNNGRIPKMDKVFKASIKEIKNRSEVDLTDRGENIDELANMEYLLGNYNLASKYDLISISIDVLAEALDNDVREMDLFKKGLRKEIPNDLDQIKQGSIGSNSLSRVKNNLNLILNYQNPQKISSAFNDLNNNLNLDLKVDLSQLP